MFKDSNEKWSFIRGCSLLGISLLLLLAVLFSGCASQDDIDDGQADILTLVNPCHSLEEDYVPPLASLNEGIEVDARALEALIELLDSCVEAGGKPYVCSAYRSYETQSALYEDKVGRMKASGMDEDLARIAAAREVAAPGTSEHQLGLAVDIIDSEYSVLDEAQADTPTQKWLMENSWRYGFILRYPEGKSEFTGIIFEPWHYRYVGTNIAKDIFESGLCFEQWLEQNK